MSQLQLQQTAISWYAAMIYAINHSVHHILHGNESESVGKIATPAEFGKEMPGILGPLCMGMLNYH